MNDKKILEISCKEMLMEIVKDSNLINKQLTFEQKVLLYDYIQALPLKEISELLLYEGSPREVETPDERDTKYGAATTGGGIAGFKAAKLLRSTKSKGIIAGAVIGTGALFLFRKLTDKCFKENIGKVLTPRKRKIATLECRLEAIRNVIEKLHEDFEKCDSLAPNQEKCKDKISMEIQKWRSKAQEHIVAISKLRS
jgi:hypothetical protein